MAMAENHSNEGRESRPAMVKVWDIAVRIFHWSLVLSFIIAWVTADEWDKVHEIAGYVIAGLVAFRLIWGIVGTKYARFSSFVYRPKILLDYLRDEVYQKSKRYLGHNPAGGAMIIALLVMLSIATASGYAMTTNMFFGIEWVEELHETTVNVLLLLVFLHVAGVIYSSISHKENLVRAMITGLKRP